MPKQFRQSHHWTWIRSTSLGMCFVFTYVNIIYGAIEPAKSFWEERKATREKIAGEASKVRVPLPLSGGTSLLAQLPALKHHLLPNNLQNPGSIVPLPSAQTSIPDRPAFLSGRPMPRWLEALPASYVSVKDIYLPPHYKPGDFMVVHIQDAHENVEAQRNISAILTKIAEGSRDSCLVSRNDTKGDTGDSPLRVSSPESRAPSYETRVPILVGIEGARGAFNFAPYRSFPDPAITHEIADYFLKNNFITGPEYVGMTYDLAKEETLAPTFWGIEDESLYLSHVQALKDSAALQKEAIAQIEQVAQQMEVIKSKELNPTLRELDKNITLHHKGKIGLGEYVRYLTGSRVSGLVTTQKGTQEIRPYESRVQSPIQMFLSALKLEESLDYKKVESERASLTRALAEKLPTYELQNLLKASLSYRLENLTHGAFYQYLKDLCSTYGILLVSRNSRAGGLGTRDSFLVSRNDKNESSSPRVSSPESRAPDRYPEMDKYIRYVLLSDKIRAEDLLAEVESLEKKVLTRAIKNNEELEIVEQSRTLGLMEKLVKHELSPQEWEEYKKYRSRASGNPARAGGNSVVGAQHVAPLQPFEKFNEIALARNDVLVKNLLEKCNSVYQPLTPNPETRGLEGSFLVSRNDKNESRVPNPRITNHEPSSHKPRATSPQPLAVLVAGGFHTEGMMDILKNKKVAYAVLTPRLGKVEGTGSEYLSIFTRDKTALEKLFTGERITLPDQSAIADSMGAKTLPKTVVIQNSTLGFGAVKMILKYLKTQGVSKSKDRKREFKRIKNILEEYVKAAQFSVLKEVDLSDPKISEDPTSPAPLKALEISFQNLIDGNRVETPIKFSIVADGTEVKVTQGLIAKIGGDSIAMSPGSFMAHLWSRFKSIAKTEVWRVIDEGIVPYLPPKVIIALGVIFAFFHDLGGLLFIPLLVHLNSKAPVLTREDVDRLSQKGEKGIIKLEKALKPESKGGIKKDQTELRQYIWNKLLENSFKHEKIKRIEQIHLPTRGIQEYIKGLGHIILKGRLPPKGKLYIGKMLGRFKNYGGSDYELEINHGIPVRILFLKDLSVKIFFPIVDNKTSEMLGFHTGKIKKDKFSKLEDATVYLELDDNGVLSIGGPKSGIESQMFSKDSRQAMFYNHPNERGKIIVKEGIIHRFISLETNFNVEFALVWNKTQEKYTTGFLVLSEEKLNQMGPDHEIHEFLVTREDGYVSLGGKCWMNVGFGKKVQIIDIQNPSGKKAFIVGAEVVENGKVVETKRLSLIYEVPPKSLPESFERGPLFNVFGNRVPSTLNNEDGSKLNSYILSGIRTYNAGYLTLSDYRGKFSLYPNASVEVKVIAGEKKFIRFIKDEKGDPILDVQGKPLIVDLKQGIYSQMMEKSFRMRQIKFKKLTEIYAKGERFFQEGNHKEAEKKFASVILLISRISIPLMENEVLLAETAGHYIVQCRAIIHKKREKGEIIPISLKPHYNQKITLDDGTLAGLIKGIRSGQDSAITQLVESYIWLVKEEATRFAHQSSDYYEEILQNGILLLYDIATEFSTVSNNTEISFDDFSRERLRNDFKTKRNGRIRESFTTTSLQSPMRGHDEDEGSPLMDVLIDLSSSKDEETLVSEIDLNRALSQLPDLERNIVISTIVKEISVNEIAGLYEVAPEEVNRILESGLEKLKKIVEGWNPSLFSGPASAGILSLLALRHHGVNLKPGMILGLGIPLTALEILGLYFNVPGLSHLTIWAVGFGFLHFLLLLAGGHHSRDAILGGVVPGILFTLYAFHPLSAALLHLAWDGVSIWLFNSASKFQSQPLGLKNRKKGIGRSGINIRFSFNPTVVMTQTKGNDWARKARKHFIRKSNKTVQLLASWIVSKKPLMKSSGDGSGMPVGLPYLWVIFLSILAMSSPSLIGNILPLKTPTGVAALLPLTLAVLGVLLTAGPLLALGTPMDAQPVLTTGFMGGLLTALSFLGVSMIKIKSNKSQGTQEPFNFNRLLSITLEIRELLDSPKQWMEIKTSVHEKYLKQAKELRKIPAFIKKVPILGHSDYEAKIKYHLEKISRESPSSGQTKERIRAMVRVDIADVLAAIPLSDALDEAAEFELIQWVESQELMIWLSGNNESLTAMLKTAKSFVNGKTPDIQKAADQYLQALQQLDPASTKKNEKILRALVFFKLRILENSMDVPAPALRSQEALLKELTAIREALLLAPSSEGYQLQGGVLLELSRMANNAEKRILVLKQALDACEKASRGMGLADETILINLAMVGLELRKIPGANDPRTLEEVLAPLQKVLALFKKHREGTTALDAERLVEIIEDLIELPPDVITVDFLKQAHFTPVTAEQRQVQEVIQLTLGIISDALRQEFELKKRKEEEEHHRHLELFMSRLREFIVLKNLEEEEKAIELGRAKKSKEKQLQEARVAQLLAQLPSNAKLQLLSLLKEETPNLQQSAAMNLAIALVDAAHNKIVWTWPEIQMLVQAMMELDWVNFKDSKPVADAILKGKRLSSQEDIIDWLAPEKSSGDRGPSKGSSFAMFLPILSFFLMGMAPTSGDTGAGALLLALPLFGGILGIINRNAGKHSQSADKIFEVRTLRSDGSLFDNEKLIATFPLLGGMLVRYERRGNVIDVNTILPIHENRRVFSKADLQKLGIRYATDPKTGNLVTILQVRLSALRGKSLGGLNVVRYLINGRLQLGLSRRDKQEQFFPQLEKEWVQFFLDQEGKGDPLSIWPVDDKGQLRSEQWLLSRQLSYSTDPAGLPLTILPDSISKYLWRHLEGNEVILHVPPKGNLRFGAEGDYIKLSHFKNEWVRFFIGKNQEINRLAIRPLDVTGKVWDRKRIIKKGLRYVMNIETGAILGVFPYSTFSELKKFGKIFIVERLNQQGSLTRDKGSIAEYSKFPGFLVKGLINGGVYTHLTILDEKFNPIQKTDELKIVRDLNGEPLTSYKNDYIPLFIRAQLREGYRIGHYYLNEHHLLNLFGFKHGYYDFSRWASLAYRPMDIIFSDLLKGEPRPSEFFFPAHEGEPEVTIKAEEAFVQVRWLAHRSPLGWVHDGNGNREYVPTISNQHIEDGIHNKQMISQIQNRIKELPINDRKIVDALYNRFTIMEEENIGEALTEIANQFGVSVEKVRAILRTFADIEALQDFRLGHKIAGVPGFQQKPSVPHRKSTLASRSLRIGKVPMKMEFPVDPRGRIDGAGPVNALIEAGYLDRLAERSIRITDKLTPPVVPDTQMTVTVGDTTYHLTFAWESVAVSPGFNIQRIEGGQGADVFIAGVWQRFEPKQESPLNPEPFSKWSIGDHGRWKAIQGSSGSALIERIRLINKVNGWTMKKIANAMNISNKVFEKERGNWSKKAIDSSKGNYPSKRHLKKLAHVLGETSIALWHGYREEKADVGQLNLLPRELWPLEDQEKWNDLEEKTSLRIVERIKLIIKVNWLTLEDIHQVAPNLSVDSMLDHFKNWKKGTQPQKLTLEKWARPFRMTIEELQTGKKVLPSALPTPKSQKTVLPQEPEKGTAQVLPIPLSIPLKGGEDGANYQTPTLHEWGSLFVFAWLAPPLFWPIVVLPIILYFAVKTFIRDTPENAIKRRTKEWIPENSLSPEDLLPPIKRMPSEVVGEYQRLLGLNINPDQAQVEANRLFIHKLATLFNGEVAAIRAKAIRQNKASVVSLKAEGFNVGQLLNSWKAHMAAGGNDANFYITFYSVSGMTLEDAMKNLKKDLAGHKDLDGILARVQGIGTGTSDDLSTVYQKNLEILQNLAGKNLLVEYIMENDLAYLSEVNRVIYRILGEGFLLRTVTPVEGIFEGVRLMDIQA